MTVEQDVLVSGFSEKISEKRWLKLWLEAASPLTVSSECCAT